MVIVRKLASISVARRITAFVKNIATVSKFLPEKFQLNAGFRIRSSTDHREWFVFKKSLPSTEPVTVPIILRRILFFSMRSLEAVDASSFRNCIATQISTCLIHSTSRHGVIKSPLCPWSFESPCSSTEKSNNALSESPTVTHNRLRSYATLFLALQFFLCILKAWEEIRPAAVGLGFSSQDQHALSCLAGDEEIRLKRRTNPITGRGPRFVEFCVGKTRKDQEQLSACAMTQRARANPYNYLDPNN